MLQKILIGMILAAAIFGYIYTLKTDVRLAKAEIASLTIETASAKEAMITLQNSVIKQQALLTTHDEEISNSRALLNAALSIFEDHDLEFLSFSKPELIESRVNAATKELFNVIEIETAN